MRMYVEGEIESVFEEKRNSIQKQIENESEDYLLNVNQIEYCTYLSSQHIIDTVELHFESVTVDSYEKDIPANRFPDIYSTLPGKIYKQDVIRFHIPYSGDIDLMRYRPSSKYTLSGGMEIKTSEGALLLEYINFGNDSQEIKKRYEQDLNSIRGNYSFLRKDCETFNNKLPSFATSVFERRKRQLLSKNNLLAELGIPLKEKKNVPRTFSVPAPKTREKIKVRPRTSNSKFEPEPTLDDRNYRRILEIIHDVGSNFEKYPSTYTGKGEEDLRDHILLVLQPNFEHGSVTGETFNKTGKTDILLRYESSNVFIGECKIWKGKKQLHSTIDQLLKYSTWRDTKSAIIFFVRNKEITNVLETAKKETMEHQNFLGFVDQTDENWFNYRLHLNGDLNREIKVAIMLYHMPK